MSDQKPFRLTYPGVYRCRNGKLKVMKRAHFTSLIETDPWYSICGAHSDKLYQPNGHTTGTNDDTDDDIVELVLAVDDEGNPKQSEDASDVKPTEEVIENLTRRSVSCCFCHVECGSLKRLKEHSAECPEHPAVKQLAELKAQHEWQPIETAPKDGAPILFCVQDGDTYVVTEGEWCGTRQEWDSAWHELSTVFCNPYLPPTHWMPRPERPVQEAML